MKLISESPISIRIRWCSVICLDWIGAKCDELLMTQYKTRILNPTYERSIHFFTVKSNLTFVKIGSKVNIGAFSFVLFLYNDPRWPLIPDNLDENMWLVSKSSSSRSSNESKLGNSPDSLKITFYTQRPVREALPRTRLLAIIFISIIACPKETFWRILFTLDTDFIHYFNGLRNLNSSMFPIQVDSGFWIHRDIPASNIPNLSSDKKFICSWTNLIPIS